MSSCRLVCVVCRLFDQLHFSRGAERESNASANFLDCTRTDRRNARNTKFIMHSASVNKDEPRIVFLHTHPTTCPTLIGDDPLRNWRSHVQVCGS